MNTPYNELKEVGLKEKEARVYISILELGEANIAQISLKSEINRSTVYLALKTLRGKGLIHSVKKNRTLFYAEDPRKILSDLERKRVILEKAMPSLLASFAFIDKKPEIKYFEGEKGIKEIFEDILKTPNQEMLSWYSNKYKEFFDEKFFFDYFIPERKRKKIWLRTIYPENSSMRELASSNTEQLRQSRFVDAEKFELESEICLWDKNKIGIISYRDKFGVIISSQSTFNTLKSIFEVMWDGAKN